MRERGAAADWPAAGRGRVAFRPGMSALPAYLADGLTVMTERHAGFLHAQDAGWGVRHFPAADMRPGEVASEGGEILAADAVVLAVPAPQATGLLTAAGHRFAAAAGRVTMAPCWAVMARFAAPVGGPDVLEPQDGPIAWAAREGSRPGADATVEAWMLHASSAWSRTHLEDAPDAVASALLAAFRTITGTGEAVSVRAHRWRYARVETPLGEPCLWDPARRLGLCGDWCIDGRVEAAFDSGAALAARLTGG
jgi:predicted NAD/FAD-dependent oxidoreductase